MTKFPARRDAEHPLRSQAATRALLANPKAMNDIVFALSDRVTDAGHLTTLMDKASRTAVRHLPGVDWAGVTTQFDGTPSTASHTDSRVLEVDERQYDVQDGPCLRAMRGDVVTSMGAAEVGAAWPQLAEVARAVGVHSFRAAPLHARLVSIGSINLYSSLPKLPDAEPDLLQVIIDYLDRGLGDYLDACSPDAPELNARLGLAGGSRVEQAVGVMMSTYGFSPDYAHARLEEAAQAANRHLIDEANRVIDGSARPSEHQS